MSAKDNGGAAFPANPNNAHCDPGMTLRDWFAGQYLAGMGTWTPGEPPPDISYGLSEWHAWCVGQRAAYAYQQADAMLGARST